MNATLKSPLSISERVSAEKAEKVVNPPKNPVDINNFMLSDIVIDLLNETPISMPITKHPMMLTVSVPKGNPCSIRD